jgi:hypothetical protein
VEQRYRHIRYRDARCRLRGGGYSVGGVGCGDAQHPIRRLNFGGDRCPPKAKVTRSNRVGCAIAEDNWCFSQRRRGRHRETAFKHGPSDDKDVNLTLRCGEVVALSGSSGAGKSAVLRIVMGLVDPSSGEVSVNGRRLRAAHVASFRARIACVFQNEDFGFSTVLRIHHQRQWPCTCSICGTSPERQSGHHIPASNHQCGQILPAHRQQLPVEGKRQVNGAIKLWRSRERHELHGDA